MGGPAPNVDISRVLERFAKDELAIPEQCPDFLQLVNDELGNAGTETDGFNDIMDAALDLLPDPDEVAAAFNDQIAEMLGSADRLAAVDDGYIDTLVDSFNSNNAATWADITGQAATPPDPGSQIPGTGDGSLAGELPPAGAITDDALINPLLAQFLSKVPTQTGGGATGGGGPTPTPTGINPRPPQRGKKGLISVLSDGSVNWVVGPNIPGPISVYVTDASGRNLFGSDYNGSQVAPWLWNNTAVNVSFTVEDGNGTTIDQVDTSTMPLGIEAG